MNHPEPSSEQLIAVGDLMDEFIRSHRGSVNSEVAIVLDYFAVWLVATGRMSTEHGST